MNNSNHNQESGIAIILVMTSIMLLLILLANFSFDTDLNKLKVYNSQDLAQAKLNAEAGIHFALSKLRLYQEARNTLEKNQSLKDVIPESQLQSIMTQPLIYPPPISESADIIQKTAVSDFTKSSLIEGSISVSIRPISGFINPNNLRFPELTAKEKNQSSNSDLDGTNDNVTSEDLNIEEAAKELQDNLEKELVKIIQTGIQEKIEEDPKNQLTYGEIDPEMRVKELKYYVNDKDKFKDDAKSEIEALYSDAEVKPKHAPLSSITELHLLVGWNDLLINLIKDRLTVHESAIIPINEITENQLKLIFPTIEETQINQFFIYRDGDATITSDDGSEEAQAHPFKNVDEFKSVITTKIGIVDEAGYDERITTLKKSGLSLGVAGKLFVVSSRGEMRNAVYELEAIVDLPIKETKKKETKSEQKNSSKKQIIDDEEDDEVSTSSTTKSDSSKKEEEDTPIELWPPRIVEITVQ